MRFVRFAAVILTALASQSRVGDARAGGLLAGEGPRRKA